MAAGVRVISPDRASYGRLSPQPGRSMADWPHDVAALTDALGIERFAVAGHSSGGPYAVVCAALLPDRVWGLVTLGGVTDTGWPGAWEGYFESELELMLMPDEESVVAWCVEQLGGDGSQFMAASGMDLLRQMRRCSFVDYPSGALPVGASSPCSLSDICRTECARTGSD